MILGQVTMNCSTVRLPKWKPVILSIFLSEPTTFVCEWVGKRLDRSEQYWNVRLESMHAEKETISRIKGVDSKRTAAVYTQVARIITLRISCNGTSDTIHIPKTRLFELWVLRFEFDHTGIYWSRTTKHKYCSFTYQRKLIYDSGKFSCNTTASLVQASNYILSRRYRLQNAWSGTRGLAQEHKVNKR